MTQDIADHRKRSDADEQYIRPPRPVVATQKLPRPAVSASYLTAMARRDNRAPGVTHDHRSHDSELLKRLVKQVSLLISRPDATA